MKHFFLLLFTTCLLLFTLSNCTTSTNTPSPAGGGGNGGGSGGGFTCNINGQPFVASTAYAYRQGDGITIQGSDSTGKYVSLQLDDHTIGNHTLSYRATDIGIYKAVGVSAYLHSSSALYGLNTGSISLSSINTNTNSATGTFNFGAYDILAQTSVTITNGMFTNLPIYDSLAMLQSTAGYYSFGSLSVLENGLSWKPTVVFAKKDTTPIISIVGSNGDFLKRITVWFPAYTPPGTYPLDTIGTIMHGVICEELLDTLKFFLPGSGSITITQNNPLTHDVKGYFSADLENFKSDTLPHRIYTNGVFKARYVQQ